MGNVVLQKGLEAPPKDKMKAAFHGVPGLTPADAMMMCKNSLGILVRGLGQEQAQQVQAALAAQGVETEVVDQAELPALPPMRHVTRVDCTAESLMIFDPLGRSFPLNWSDIMLVAAGKVSVIEFKRVSTLSAMSSDPSAGMGLGIVDDLLFKNSGFRPPGDRTVISTEPNYETKEEHHQRWTAEIVIRGGGLRYNFDADQPLQPLFSYLRDRRTDDVTENFKLFVQDLCQSAPAAALNRGAYYLREGDTSTFVYSSKNSFYDEMTWLLWRLKSQS
jgi:hypothetical protein